ncbi:MAG: nucleotidyltransferase family protein [Bacillota bacterium]|nr:nucleotidyltransferase family protein [Bacillota bacterium]
MFNAVVLAGSSEPELLAEMQGVPNKAFILLKEKPLLSYVLRALHGAPVLNNITVVGPPGDLELLRGGEGLAFEIIDQQESLLANLAVAFETMDPEKLCLVVTADIPLLTADIVEKFISFCAPYEADFYYPILSRETCVEKYPENIRTYVRLKEGQVTGGNAVLIKPGWYLQNQERLEMFISYRKKPLQLFRIFPLTMIMKYLLRSLSVHDLEKYLSDLLGFEAKAVLCDCIELGIDVDKISDLELVRKIMHD